jgi:hypothetical protein
VTVPSLLIKEGRMDAINPKERRTVIRHSGDTIEPVRLRLDEREIVARVLDISVAGIGILTCQTFEPGTWLVLEPAKSKRCLSPELRAEVRHVRKSDEKDYLVGCRFSRLLSIDDMTALG